MNLLEGLNDRQREAVTTTEGPVLVLAGAGSGKTSVVTKKIAYLMEEKKVYPSKILAITFTNKAANEMKTRVERLIHTDFNMWIGTFHSIAVRILRRDIDRLGYDRNFTIYDTKDQQTVVKDIIKRMDLSADSYKPRTIQAKISSIKNSGGRVEDVLSESIYSERITKEIYYEYEKELKKNNALDFDDLILKSVELLRNHEEVKNYYRDRFEYVFVDEYQDTNKSQYEMVRLICRENPNLTVVGDNDQSIYAWRGADISNILNFEKDFKNAKVVLLEQNYRSTKNILDAANSLIANNPTKYKKNLWTSSQGGETVKYKIYSSSFDEEKCVIEKIDDLHRDYPFEDMAILYRTNAQSRGFEEHLMRAGIAYRVVGGLKFYDRKEVKDIISYMQFIVNTDDEVSLARIINTPRRGIGDQTVESIRKAAIDSGKTMYEIIKNLDEYNLNIRASKNIKKFVEIIENLREKKDSITIHEFIEEVCRESGYIEDLEKENTVESRSRIENIEELINSSYEYEKNYEEPNLEEYLSSLSLLSDVDKSEDTGGVSLMTVHGAKGLEFKVVFLVGMEERVFPSGRSMDEDDEVEEERRLAYVAITRAKEQLFVSSCKSRNSYGQPTYNKPSRFIEEMGSIEYLDTVDSELRIDYDRKSKINRMNSISKNFRSQREKKAEQKLNTSKDFSIGDKVKHRIFGQGMIVSVTKKDDDEELVVAFDNGNIKRLMKSHAPLESLNE